MVQTRQRVGVAANMIATPAARQQDDSPCPIIMKGNGCEERDDGDIGNRLNNKRAIVKQNFEPDYDRELNSGDEGDKDERDEFEVEDDDIDDERKQESTSQGVSESCRLDVDMNLVTANLSTGTNLSYDPRSDYHPEREYFSDPDWHDERPGKTSLSSDDKRQATNGQRRIASLDCDAGKHSNEFSNRHERSQRHRQLEELADGSEMSDEEGPNCNEKINRSPLSLEPVDNSKKCDSLSDRLELTSSHQDEDERLPVSLNDQYQTALPADQVMASEAQAEPPLIDPKLNLANKDVSRDGLEQVSNFKGDKQIDEIQAEPEHTNSQLHSSNLNPSQLSLESQISSDLSHTDNVDVVAAESERKVPEVSIAAEILNPMSMGSQDYSSEHEEVEGASKLSSSATHSNPVGGEQNNEAFYNFLQDYCSELYEKIKADAFERFGSILASRKEAACTALTELAVSSHPDEQVWSKGSGGGTDSDQISGEPKELDSSDQGDRREHEIDGKEVPPTPSISTGKRIYTSSLFYDDKHGSYPTLDEQVGKCQTIAKQLEMAIEESSNVVSDGHKDKPTGDLATIDGYKGRSVDAIEGDDGEFQQQQQQQRRPERASTMFKQRRERMCTFTISSNEDADEEAPLSTDTAAWKQVKKSPSSLSLGKQTSARPESSIKSRRSSADLIDPDWPTQTKNKCDCDSIEALSDTEYEAPRVSKLLRRGNFLHQTSTGNEENCAVELSANTDSSRSGSNTRRKFEPLYKPYLDSTTLKDIERLREWCPETDFNQHESVPPEVCHKLVQDLRQTGDCGGENRGSMLFERRQQQSSDWIVGGSDLTSKGSERNQQEPASQQGEQQQQLAAVNNHHQFVRTVVHQAKSVEQVSATITSETTITKTADVNVNNNKDYLDITGGSGRVVERSLSANSGRLSRLSMGEETLMMVENACQEPQLVHSAPLVIGHAPPKLELAKITKTPSFSTSSRRLIECDSDRSMSRTSLSSSSSISLASPRSLSPSPCIIDNDDDDVIENAPVAAVTATGIGLLASTDEPGKESAANQLTENEARIIDDQQRTNIKAEIKPTVVSECYHLDEHFHGPGEVIIEHKAALVSRARPQSRTSQLHHSSIIAAECTTSNLNDTSQSNWPDRMGAGFGQLQYATLEHTNHRDTHLRELDSCAAIERAPEVRRLIDEQSIDEDTIAIGGKSAAAAALEPEFKTSGGNHHYSRYRETLSSRLEKFYKFPPPSLSSTLPPTPLAATPVLPPNKLLLTNEDCHVAASDNDNDIDEGDIQVGKQDKLSRLSSGPRRVASNDAMGADVSSLGVFYEVEALADGHKQQQHWQQEPRQDSGLRGMHKLEQIAPLVSKERGTWLDSGEYDADADADPDSDEANGLAQPPPDILCRCKCTCGALSQASSLARRYRRPATPAYCRQQRRYKAELSSRIEPLASDGGTTPEDNHLDSHRYRRQLHSASAQPPPVATKPVLHLDDSMLVPTRPSPFINNISSTTASTCEAPKYDMVSNTIGGGGGGVVGSTSAVAAAAVDRKYNCDGCSNVATTATWSCPVSSSLSSSPLRRDSVRVEMNQIGSLNDLTRSASAGPPAWNSRQVGGPTRLDMMIAADHRQHHQALGEPRTIWSIAPATAPARHYSANQLPSSWRFAPKSLSASAAVPLLEHVLPPAGRRYQSQCVKLNDCKSSLAASSHFQLSTSGRRRDTMSRRDNENCSDNGADNAPPSTFKSIKNQCYLGGWSQQQQSTDVPISAPRPPTRACSHQQQCHNPILVGYHSDNALAANSDDQFGAQAATGGREKLLSLSGEQGANNYEDAWTLAGKTSSVVGGEGGGRDDNNVSGEESAIQQGRVCSLRVRICMPNTAKVERIFIERRPNVNYIQRLEPPANETSREPASYAN